MSNFTPGLLVAQANAAQADGTFSPPPQIIFWAPTPDINGGGEGETFMSNPWDFAVFNGTKLPGIWKCHGLPTLAIDKKRHSGTDGIAITANGYVPGPVEMEGMLWTSRQWGFFQTIAPQIWRRPAKTANSKFPVALAATIEHPGLALWGISKFVVVGVSPPEAGPIKQSMIIKIKGIEFVGLDGKKRTQTAGDVVPLASPLQPAKGSSLNRPPSETDAGIHGAAIDHRGGED